ncbi:MAG: glycosyltransferase family 4 protein [Gemmatimonadota bacterium]|nr:glycosyltransferase family 4 protein [Gemmatimonadota bacterium]
MKIMMVTGSYPPLKDGVGDYTYRLCYTLRQFLGEDSVYVVSTRTGRADEEHPGDFPVVAEWNLKGIVQVIKQIRSLRPDVVHIQYPAAGYKRHLEPSFMPILIRFAARSAKVISTIHEYNNRSFFGKFRLLINIVTSHNVIVVSRQYIKAIHRVWPFRRPEMFYIPDGTNILVHDTPDAASLQAIKEELRLTEDPTIICWFGVLRPGKNLRSLIRTFHTLRQRHTYLKLLLLGRNEEPFYSEELKPELERLDLMDHVIITDERPSEFVSACFGLSDICVLPFEDGVTTKRGSFMAALQHELPMVTTISNAIPEGLVDNHNIFLVPPDDEDSLLEKIETLLLDRSLRETFRKNLKAITHINSWERIAQQTIDLYSNVCGVAVHDHSSQDGSER